MAISKAERDRRFARGQKSAQRTIAAKEIFSLRLSPQTIERIYEIAASQNLHASDLVRGWIEKCAESADLKPGAAQSPELVALVREALREELSELGLYKVASKKRHS
jgi:hypothetical protein